MITNPKARTQRMENAKAVVLEVTGYARGRQLVDKKLVRVRENGGSYRAAKSPDFGRAVHWLAEHGYRLQEVVGPGYKTGPGTVRYFYRKPAKAKRRGPEDHSDAVLADNRSRRRDRLFKVAR